MVGFEAEFTAKRVEICLTLMFEADLGLRSVIIQCQARELSICLMVARPRHSILYVQKIHGDEGNLQHFCPSRFSQGRTV